MMPTRVANDNLMTSGKNGVANRMDPSWYEKPTDADTKKTVV